jgi:hypothetical protein
MNTRLAMTRFIPEVSHPHMAQERGAFKDNPLT